jgi:hypothetical protein
MIAEENLKLWQNRGANPEFLYYLTVRVYN